MKIFSVFCLCVLWTSVFHTVLAELETVEDLFKEKVAEKPEIKKREVLKPDTSKVAPSEKEVNQPVAVSSSKSSSDEGFFNRKSPVFYKSNSLKGDLNSKVVELIGDVVVSQDKLVLRGDRAKLFSDESGKEISQVWVKGNVKVLHEFADTNKTAQAYGDEAYFYSESGLVVVKNNAKFKRNDDILEGYEISYRLSSGSIKVDQVEGMVKPENEE